MMNRFGLPGGRRRYLLAAGSLVLAFVNITGALLKLAPARHSIVRAMLGGSAPGAPRFLLLLAGLLLIAAIPGLVRAKRMAFAITFSAALTSVALHPLRVRDPDDAGALIALAVTIGLATSFRLFPARSDPLRIRQGLWWLIGGEAFVFLMGFVGLYFVDREVVEPMDAPEALGNAFRLLFVLPTTTIPESGHVQRLIEAIRGLSLVVLAISAWHLVHPVLNRRFARPSEREHVKTILSLHATTALAPFHLLDDKTYAFSNDGQAFLSFRMVGSTAVVLGEPVGPAESATNAAREFIEMCSLNGWRFGFHQVTGAGADALTAMGLKKIKIGEEAIIPIQTFSLAGKSFKHLRNIQHSLEREGFVVEELPQPLDGAVLDELQAVSDAWMAADGHRERTFTLGQFDRDYLRETRVFVVWRKGGRIEAFANVVARYRSADATFDLMRRRPDSPNGVMDLLLLHFIELFRADGCDGLNLGLAPLANVDEPGPKGAALRLMYERGNVAFNFRGLRSYKDKWNPIWFDRYLVYRSDVDLVPVALAVARVGEKQGLVARFAHASLGRARRRQKPA